MHHLLLPEICLYKGLEHVLKVIFDNYICVYAVLCSYFYIYLFIFPYQPPPPTELLIHNFVSLCPSTFN